MRRAGVQRFLCGSACLPLHFQNYFDPLNISVLVFAISGPFALRPNNISAGSGATDLRQGRSLKGFDPDWAGEQEVAEYTVFMMPDIPSAGFLRDWIGAGDDPCLFAPTLAMVHGVHRPPRT